MIIVSAGTLFEKGESECYLMGNYDYDSFLLDCGCGFSAGRLACMCIETSDIILFKGSLI